jgi:pimeloyl-ACP methyl ester carboxylesterase
VWNISGIREIAGGSRNVKRRRKPPGIVPSWRRDRKSAGTSYHHRTDQDSYVADKIELDWQASFAADPGAPRLSVLAERTLLVRGERSPAPMRRLVDALHALMLGSARAIVPGAAHLIPLTHPAALFAVLMQHLHAAFERRMR